MKNRYKITALFAAALISLSLMTACGKNNQTSSNTSSSVTPSSSVTTSQTEINSNNNADETPSNNETNVSASESSSDENSDVTNESSTADSSLSDSSSDSSVTSDSSLTSTDSSSSQTSDDQTGYYFDDEQIVKDYHTAKVFTSNDDFNKLFAKNSIDAEYNKELQDAGSISEMRTVTSNYAQKWKDEATTAYNKLSELLKDKPEAKTALDKSQNDWTNGLQDTQSSFYSQASGEENGSEELLNADTAIMNYYKGRAAILYEQIYELTGKFDM